MKHSFQIVAISLVLITVGTAAAQTGPHGPATQSEEVSVATSPSALSKPVARVNGAVLTDRDLVREEYVIFPYAKQHGGKIPRAMEADIRDGALQMIIFDELVYQEARKRGLTISPARLNRAEADLRKQFGSPAEFRYFVKSEFEGSEKLLRDKITRSLLIEQVLKTEVENKSNVSEAQLRTFYEQNPKNFEYPESFAIQTISIIPPANATPAQLKQARQRANEALSRAKATKTAPEFGRLAEKISEDDYRVMMGDHKWVHADKMPPQMLEPALKMQPGEVSGLVQVDGNYVVFRMNRHVPAGKVEFSEIKEKLRTALEKKKADELRAEFGRKLRKNAKIETL
jgi:parvulin-like peptidyl-prolyl isomerase